MLYFKDAPSAVRCVLDLVDRAEGEGLPPIHAGVNAGEVVRRDGDLFGTVVNITARTADYARPREVLVTAATVAAWDGGDDVRFVQLGPIAFKNVLQPVDIYQAGRSAREAG